MMAADIRVGPGRPACGANTRGTRVSPLARLLLFSARVLRALLVTLPMTACIIPVGPEFHDPYGVPNSPPYIISAIPLDGTRTSTTDTFTITPSDNNVGDTLYIRWLIDYPPFIPDVSAKVQSQEIGPRQDGMRWRDPIRHTFDCFGVTSPSPHRVTVIVSDEQFLDEPTNPGAVPMNFYPAVVSWEWERECPR